MFCAKTCVQAGPPAKSCKPDPKFLACTLLECIPTMPNFKHNVIFFHNFPAALLWFGLEVTRLCEHMQGCLMQ